MSPKPHPVESLQRAVLEKLPKARIQVDRPRQATGSWFLDAGLNRHSVHVEWRPKHGFGISAGDIGFGEGPDEVYKDPEKAAERVIQLLMTSQQTRPPDTVLLSRLRDMRRVTQAQLAEKLGVTQANVSKIERQEDWFVSTLRSFIEAMGGQLEIRALFQDGTVKIEPCTEANPG